MMTGCFSWIYINGFIFSALFAATFLQKSFTTLDITCLSTVSLLPIIRFYLGTMINSQANNARNAGIKQKKIEIKNDFTKSLDNLKFVITDNLSMTNY